ncbi:alcohol dehydrogenase [Actinobacteria bacterium YIM 96077]|uniref:Alcohol dehydrogenase n=1 Tax=Phytoactinopolyspora halophila TaxID=1981511 RepID=A0A329QJG1_9ACTN|nr:zinc-binding dehydrogenase [Phytoactinopolyspora halophila]AYY12519.1 alcohol dehydrogenase [Actinobacteria bacterium YIM 96077]RAW12577.1 alcohol dehydrogenase [Phytoactinopolyspora halophila]
MALPTTTAAAVLTEHGQPLTLQDVPLPERLEPGGALVRITCTTLCGTDAHLWSGQMSLPGMLPMILGHEMVGEVVATGAGTVDTLGRPVNVGDRIGWSESTCGTCYGCSVLRQPVACRDRGYGFRQRADQPPYVTGGLAEYCVVTPGAAKLLLPADVKDTWAAMSGCAAKTVLRAVERTGGIRTGSTVVIQGAGALGIFAAAVASISGAAAVIVVGGPDDRLAAATRFGATATVPVEATTTDERASRVLGLTGGLGADHVFDFAGAPTVGEEAVAFAAQRGTITVVGSTGPRPAPVALGTVMGKELTVVGSLNGDIADYYRSIEFFRTFAGRLPWDELFSAPVALSEASASVDAMSRLAQIKAVIDPRLPSGTTATTST